MSLKQGDVLYYKTPEGNLVKCFYQSSGYGFYKVLLNGVVKPVRSYNLYFPDGGSLKYSPEKSSKTDVLQSAAHKVQSQFEVQSAPTVMIFCHGSWTFELLRYHKNSTPKPKQGYFCIQRPDGIYSGPDVLYHYAKNYFDYDDILEAAKILTRL